MIKIKQQLTDNDILEQLKNVDGEGSGLDADTVRTFPASQSPQANTIPVLNSSGQLALPFVQTPILIGSQDMMNRTFYVDAENGDDNNDGSSSTPFKTLAKAISSIPIGGRGRIWVLSDIIVSESTSKVSVGLHKTLYIVNPSFSEIDKTITFQIRPRNTNDYNTVFGFTNVANSQIWIRGFNIIFDDQHDPDLPFDNFTQAFDYGTSTAGVFSLTIDKCNVTIPNIAGLRLSKASVYNKVCLSLSSMTLETEGNNSVPFEIWFSTFDYHVGGNVTLTGAKTEHADLFAGIVRDANDVPRNITSNIVL